MYKKEKILSVVFLLATLSSLGITATLPVFEPIRIPSLQYEIPQTCIDSENLQATVPGVPATIKDGSLTFKGCNTVFHSFTLGQGNSIAFAQGASTKIACKIDNDPVYSRRLMASEKYSIVQDNGKTVIELRDQYDQLMLRLVADSSINTQTLEGKYTLQFPPVSFNVAESTMGFTGCNGNSAGYTLKSNGQISFGLFMQTLAFCQNDYDVVVSGGMSSATRLSRIFSKDNSICEIDFSNNQGVTLRVRTKDSENIPERIDLSGKYTLNLVGSGLKPIQVTVTDTGFSFSGCNINTFGYHAKPSGDISFAGFISTKRACQIDNDSQYVRGFQNSVTYKLDKKTGDLTLYDRNGKVTLTTRAIISTPSVDLSGTYNLNLVGSGLKLITLTVTKTEFSFTGCNVNGFSYKATSDGRISFNNFYSTLRACFEGDNDGQIVKAFQSVTRYESNGKELILYDAKGNVVFTTKAQASSELVGEYTLRLARSKLSPIKVTISEDQFSFEGCNIHGFNYKTKTQGKTNYIEFSRFFSTKRACIIDNDSEYLKAFQNSVTYQIDQNTNDLTFFDQNGKVTLSTKAGFSSPSVDLSGTYQLTLVGSDLKPIQVTVTKDQFKFQGCNLQGFSYSTSSNKGVNFIYFRNFYGTQRACKVDFDQQYLKGFRQTVSFKFNQKTGSLVLLGANGNVIYTTQEKKIQDESYKILFINDKVFKDDVSINFSVGSDQIGFRGCNVNSASVTYENKGQYNQFSISSFISTRIYCVDDKDPQIRSALRQSHSLKVFGRFLVFYNEYGKRTLIFKKN